MRLWPFPKKSDVEPLSAGFDLPDGVMLAAPETEPEVPTTVPSYAAPESSQPLVDPAAGILSESPLFDPAKIAEKSDPLEEFNRMFAPGQPATFSSHVEPVPFLDIGTPTDVVPTAPAFADPSPEERQKESLDQLLAQLGKPTPTPASPLELGSLSKPAAHTDSPAQSTPSTGSWALAPTENPPLSNDWALTPLEPDTQATAIDLSAFSFSDLQNSSGLTPPAHQPENLGNLGTAQAQPAPASSLADCLSLAWEAEIQEAAAPVNLHTDFDLAPEAPQAEKPLKLPQATLPATSSMLDTLISPPPQAPMDGFLPVVPSMDAMQFGVTPNWEASAMSELEPSPVSNLSPLNDFDLAPPNHNEWHEVSDTFEFEHAPEAPKSELNPPVAEFTSSLMALVQKAAPLEIEAANDDWCDAEDMPSESAELNSSSNAYDFNHYDDPDEPTPAIELEEESDTVMSFGDLQALANQLSETRDMGAEVKPAQANHIAESDFSLEEPEENSAFDTAPSYHQEILNDFEAPQPNGLAAFSDFFADTEPQDEPIADLFQEEPAANFHSTGPAADKQPAEAPAIELTGKWESKLASYTASSESREEPMLNLKGNKATSEQSVLAALSAKFIARSKQNSPNTRIPDEAPAYLEAYQPAHEPDEDLLIDPSGLIGQLPASKLKQPSLSQAMIHFEQEMLLNETRFIKQSINNLVDRYFAQQEQDNSI